MEWGLLVGEVDLVADNHGDGAFVLVLVVEFEPLECAVEGVRVGHVVDQEAAAGVLEVAGDEALEPLLAGSVPQLQAVVAAVDGDVLDQEVDADGGLRAAGGTL